MNVVTFRLDDRQYVAGFSSKGHAGFAEEGEDIVCAGISALVITTVNSIASLTNAVVHTKSDEFTGSIECMVDNYESSDVQLLMNSLRLGLTGIQSNYGNRYVQIVFEEV